jgi:hypothetical protein
LNANLVTKEGLSFLFDSLVQTLGILGRPQQICKCIVISTALHLRYINHIAQTFHQATSGTLSHIKHMLGTNPEPLKITL